MKCCSSCKIEKDSSSFYKNKAMKDGYHNNCKSCRKLEGKKYYIDNKDEILHKNKTWYNNNKEAHHLLVEKWYSKNKSIRRERHMRRYANKITATPLWRDVDLIKDIYLEAEYFGLQVDHIVPLVSDKVCGLHWEGNMQLLSKKENASKGNRHWPDMEEDNGW